MQRILLWAYRFNGVPVHGWRCAVYLCAGDAEGFRIDFVDGEATPVLCAELDFDDVEGVDRESTDGSERVFKPYYDYGRIAKVDEKIYMWGIYGTVKRLNMGFSAFP